MSFIQELASHSDNTLEKFEAQIPASKSNWPKALGSKAFIGPIGKLVNLLEPHSEADPAGLLVQALVAFGNQIGRNKYVLAESDFHYCNFFAVMVGQSSKGRKGTSWGRIVSQFEISDPEWRKNCIVSGCSSGEGIIAAVRDPAELDVNESVALPKPRKIIEMGVTDKRLLVVETEFASVLRVLSRDGNKLSSVIRDSWDTGKLGILTKNDPIRATDAHISIIGHITKAELSKYLSQTEMLNGFANRFLWIAVKRSKILPHGGNLNLGVLSSVHIEINHAVTFGKVPGQLKFSAEARVLWEILYFTLSEERPGLIGSLTARAEAQILRLSALYAIQECSNVIEVRHLEAANEIWNYADQSCVHIFGDSTGDSIADKILANLRISAEGFTQTEIIEEIFHKNKNAQEIGRALQLLQSHGLANQCSETSTGTKPRIRWRAGKGDSTSNEFNEVNPVLESDVALDSLNS